MSDDSRSSLIRAAKQSAADAESLTWADIDETPTLDVLHHIGHLAATIRRLADALGDSEGEGKMMIEPIRLRELEAREHVLMDIHDALGIKWGDDPYATISLLREAAS